jgi:DedD protein
VERLVKERLVGAAVLLAAAVILIPEMLSGPKHEDAPLPAASMDDAPTKTYTIDLGQPSQRQSASPAPAQVETTAAPPSEPVSTAGTAAQVVPESTIPQTEPLGGNAPPPNAKPASKPQVDTSKPVAPPSTTTPKREAADAVAAVAKPAAVASERSVPTNKGWAVQLGSFAKADTAERLAQQVRSRGHEAFVMPVKSGSGTLYRVRVGPLQDRADADALQKQLKGENPNAAVVPHP